MRESQRGFTLIELTLATTLFALVAMILYGSFSLGHRAVERTGRLTERSQRLRSSEELLASYIRSTYPCRLSPPDATVSFSGGEKRLTFVSALSAGLGGRGMARVSLTWNEQEDGRGSLSVEEAVPLAAGCQESGGYKNALVVEEGVRDFRLHYLDPTEEEEKWLEEWDGSVRRLLPRAVRLSWVTEKGEAMQRVYPIMMSVLLP
jgi:prepilin-type N-terminal cleavage/methylation domain-containing protein